MKKCLSIFCYFLISILISFQIYCNSDEDKNASERKIAFYSNRDGVNTQIYVVDPDGKNLKNLSKSSSDDLHPKYSPSGKKIAYESGYRDIFIMDSSGDNKIKLTDNGKFNHSPVWSPDETMLSFRSYDDDTLSDDKFHIIYIDTLEEKIIDKSFIQYTWSPDSSKIAFEENSEIFLMNPDGTDVTSLIYTGLNIEKMQWSPDGTRILLSTYNYYVDDIYILDADGTDLIKIVTDDSYEDRPQWSRDGSKIAYFSYFPGDVEERRLFIMDADGLNSKLLTSPVGFSFAWSPDGDKIAFSSSRDGNSDIYVIDIESLDVINVSQTSGDIINFSPSW